LTYRFKTIFYFFSIINYSILNTKTEIVDLFEEIRNDNEYAFKELFVEYFQLMVNYSVKFVEDKQVAENIVADIFVKIWVNRKKIFIKSSIKSYLYKATKNSSLNHLKHVQAKQEALKELEKKTTRSNSPYEEFIVKEFAMEIQKAIDELPEKAGKVFKMHRYENLKYSEIAQKLDISIVTVETHMVRALKYLRQRLSHLLPLNSTN